LTASFFRDLEETMKYVCLVYHEEEKLRGVAERDLVAIMDECGAWVEDLEKGGHHVSSAGLQSVRTAKTLRNRRSSLVKTDGPFAETKEFLGGFTIINATDLNEAIQLASKLPAVRLGSVEVRPVLDADADVTDPLERKIVAALRLSRHSA
jgi:hypothetical protein